MSDKWMTIDSFRKPENGMPKSVIVYADGVVGEATYRPEGPAEDIGWWWANTSPGDYHAERIEDWSVSHWQPLPEPPVDIS